MGLMFADINYFQDEIMEEVPFSTLLGKTLTKITADFSVGEISDVITPEFGGSIMLIETDDGERYVMGHHQECCEQVWLEDVCGDLSDLIGSQIVEADESSNQEDDAETGGTRTWTFYKMRTKNGAVTLRWCGESNGYYSEAVSLVRLDRSGSQGA